jgi:hypothetical protein
MPLSTMFAQNESKNKMHDICHHSNPSALCSPKRLSCWSGQTQGDYLYKLFVKSVSIPYAEDMALPSKQDQYPPEDADEEKVTVHVGKGDGMRSFTMSKGILSFYSGYFRSALSGPFIEAEERIVRFPTVVSLSKYLRRVSEPGLPLSFGM